MKSELRLQMRIPLNVGRRLPISLSMGVALLAMLQGASPLLAQPPCQSNCWSIGDRVWLDTNDNGIQDAFVTEPGLPSVTVTLYYSDAEGKILNFGLPYGQMVTNGTGNYIFNVPQDPNKFYRLQFMAPQTGMIFAIAKQHQSIYDTADSDPDRYTGLTREFNVTSASSDAQKWDAGFVPSSCIEIGDTIFRDNDNDGNYDSAIDAPLPNITVELWERNWLGYDVVASATTDQNGHYSFPCAKREVIYHVVIRNAGYLPVSSFYDPNVTNHEENDNNCTADLLGKPEFDDFIKYMPSDSPGVTPPFVLDMNHPFPDSTIDCGFGCSADDLDFVVVIDTSGSMSGKLANVQAAAKVLVDQVLAGTTNRAGVVSFGSHAEPVLALTSDKALVKNTIGGLTIDMFGSDTNIGDGIKDARLLFNDPTRSRTIVLLSDGMATVGTPTQSATEFAKSEAGAAKSDGIRIATVAIGSVSKSLLQQLSSTTGDYYEIKDPENQDEIVSVYRKIVYSICGVSGIGRSFACTGNQTIKHDITTGVATWEVVLPGNDPNNPSNQQDTFVLLPHDAGWNDLPGAWWISHSPTGEGAIDSYYNYIHEFDLPVIPADIDLTLDALADDYISEIRLNNTVLQGSFGGVFHSNGLHITVDDPSYFVVGTNKFTVRVYNSTVGTWNPSGLTLSGQLHSCAVPAPTDDYGWVRRISSECNASEWGEWDDDDVEGEDHPPKPAPHPRDTDVTAYCMQVGTACCQQSLPVQVPPNNFCWGGAAITDCQHFGPCGKGQYLFPSNHDFDLGAKFYSAQWPGTASNKFPAALANPPGSFVIVGDPNGFRPIDERWANADESNYFKHNLIERYVSTCLIANGPYQVEQGCVANGNRARPGLSVFQWVVHEPYTVEPRDCPNN